MLRQIHVLGSLTLYFWPQWGKGRNANPSKTCRIESPLSPVKFQLFVLQTVQMHVEFTFFGWLTLYFWPLWGIGRIVYPATTCPEESPTFLWSFNSSSWTLWKCTSNSRSWVINTLFLTTVGERVESSTLPRPVPGFLQTFLWSYKSPSLQYCANSRRVYVFLVINP